ncbi:MAG: ATP-binding cassette domain-containing protein [Clostridia bacterium]
MINIENVSYKYKNGKQVLKNISFSVKKGEIIAIVGKNGSGKSTIGKLISGILKLKKGKILIDDIDLSKRKNRELINSKVGIVFQNPDSQIIFGNIKDEFSYITQDEAVIDEVLKYVDMFEYKNNDLYYLSLGQKQRIMIAEVLAKQPQYIIFDEPTTMIDSIGKEKIYKIIQKLKNEGYTIICITNLADEILLADRTIILNNGKIVEQIEKSELIEKSKVFEKYEIKVPTLLELLIKLKNNGIKLDTNKNLTIDSFVEELIIKLKK